MKFLCGTTLQLTWKQGFHGRLPVARVHRGPESLDQALTAYLIYPTISRT